MEENQADLELVQEQAKSEKKPKRTAKTVMEAVLIQPEQSEQIDEKNANQFNIDWLAKPKKDKETLEQFLETKVERALEDAVANPHHIDLLSSLGNMEDNRIWFSRYFHEQLRLRMAERYPVDFVREKMLSFCGNIYTCTTIAKIFSAFFVDEANAIELYNRHFYGYVFGEVMATMEDTRLLLQNSIAIIQIPSWLMDYDVIDAWLLAMVMRYRVGAPLSPRGNRLGRSGIDAILDAQPMPAQLRDYLNQKIDVLLPHLAQANKHFGGQKQQYYHQLERVALN